MNSKIGDTINRPGRASNMIESIRVRHITKLTNAAERKCFFFDPTIEHGGPAPKRKLIFFLKLTLY